jgi:DNA-binding response OmpR family regulator
VVTASDGRQAIALAVERRPDVVILDFTLPAMDGYEVTVCLRAGRAHPLPILLITADGQAPTKAAQVGSYAFLRKPFRVEELIDAVRVGLDSHGGS